MPIATGEVFQPEVRGLSFEPQRLLAWPTPTVVQHQNRQLQRERRLTWFLPQSAFVHAIVFQNFQCLGRVPRDLLVQNQGHKN